MRSIPSTTDDRPRSLNSTTRFSMSSADSPGYAHTTATTGMSIDGKMSTSMLRIDNAPISRMTAAITATVYGWRRASLTIHMMCCAAGNQRRVGRRQGGGLTTRAIPRECCASGPCITQIDFSPDRCSLLLCIMNLHLLRLFTAVVDEGGIVAAAQALNLSQPAVSRAMRELEIQLGVPLLERAGRRVRLTAEGAEIYGQARNIYAAERAAEETLADLKGLRHGVLRVGASTTIATYVLPQAHRDLCPAASPGGAAAQRGTHHESLSTCSSSSNWTSPLPRRR